MNDAVTRTKLRMGRVKKKCRQDENGVTNEELDILLADGPETDARSRKPPSRKTGRKRKKQPRQAASQ